MGVIAGAAAARPPTCGRCSGTAGSSADRGRRGGHHGQLGDVHLGRQQRPRGRGVAGLLHQPAGHRADGRVHPRGERLRPLQWAAMATRGRRSPCSPSTTGGCRGWRWSWRSRSAPTAWPRRPRTSARSRASPSRRCCSRRSPRRTSAGWSATGQSNFGSHGAGHALLFTTTGIVTAIPLICFGAAAIRVSMVTLGLLQYLAPIIQFALGVLWFHEDMPPGRWVGFVLVWVALAIFTVEAIHHHRRRQPALARDAERRLTRRVFTRTSRGRARLPSSRRRRAVVVRHHGEPSSARSRSARRVAAAARRRDRSDRPYLRGPGGLLRRDDTRPSRLRRRQARVGGPARQQRRSPPPSQATGGPTPTNDRSAVARGAGDRSGGAGRRRCRRRPRGRRGPGPRGQRRAAPWPRAARATT